MLYLPPAVLYKVDHQLTRHLGLPTALIPGGTQPSMGKFDGKAIQGVEELLFTIVLVIGYEHLEAKSISRIFYNGYELLVGTMPISKVYIEDILQWL